MSSAAPVQDLPPAGGFPHTIRYKRYLPSRGPSGAVLILGTLGIMAYGWNQLFHSNAEFKEIRREKAYARIFITPLLQAETDRDLVRRLDSLKRRETEAMKDNPDWVPFDLKAPVSGIGKGGVFDPSQSEPVYHTRRYVSPTYVYLPPPKDKEAPSHAIISPQWWRGSTMFTKNPPYHHRDDFTKEHPIGK
ncbi:hypothetical protein BASA50_003040 [Batrachochytrium salamandrivorans]|uniref:NADH dehydrogenase [ubiquinone] 1 alpha subcomplex subunit 13 n=1 Tax=Batrachochytrium salamandrivorans TaxID=1357716 RepID=A0ABQ8FMJ3_9FUNG|nr:hypothetical protein BASA62_008905 [Batrachochytrium salamandrivorans]KAH6578587.1 hypothetical protein BASA60_003553 [Batrachochytrium salamandrivorans]KAH6584039.1 hypothetical protein BASA61_007687 [Batrachochytrium salamandrivorans]KAH6584071.1 hypothetical protein BASA60_001112 [Batrachochytrium salamandrivorans]KAH6599445.1 hypothetical protein BASA50_003040 [Batrachochytrium salamandrivorans]